MGNLSIDMSSDSATGPPPLDPDSDRLPDADSGKSESGSTYSWESSDAGPAVMTGSAAGWVGLEEGPAPPEARGESYCDDAPESLAVTALGEAY